MSLINTTYGHLGRFGNLFFVGMALHFISLKNNIKSEYKEFEKFKRLGIDLFIHGKNKYDETIQLMDDNFFHCMNELIYKNVCIQNNVWCQTSNFASLLYIYFHQFKQKTKIINHNIFKYRYNQNNDLVIHVRLDDIQDSFAESYEYYDKAIQIIKKYDRGYITSDSINHEICQKLITKYNLIVIEYDDISTIMFVSTCNHVILSLGTYSWLMGLFAYYSDTICFPKISKKWHGDIFVFPEWIEIK